MGKETKELANLILDHSLKVSKGDKVVLAASDFTEIELLQDCYQGLLVREAIPYLDIMGMNFEVGRADFGGFANTYFEHATKEQITSGPDIYEAIVNWADKFIRLVAIHDKGFLDLQDSSKISTRQTQFSKYTKQILSKPWLLSYLPTEALAANSQMSLDEFRKFYYQATLVDYEQLDKYISPLESVLDNGKTVRILTKDTDLKLDITNRLAMGRNNGKHNVPDGECFIGPVEDGTNGYIRFSLPQVYGGKEMEDIYLEFEEGKVTKATSSTNQTHLLSLLDQESGNRILGELGIGMNKQITKYIKDILFDEKIYGTIHLALGSSFPYKRGGGENKASIHWDMVKDLREAGTELSVDGKVISKDGEVLI